MEFENNQPTDDEQRRLAETKKITLQPLHAGVMPDPLPDAEISAHNAQETSANTSNDSEDTSAPQQLVQPSKSALDKAQASRPEAGSSPHPTMLPLVAAFLAAIGAAAWLWIQAA